MGWIKQIITTSIGKKSVMAVTGTGLIIFLFFHLVGNSMIFLGRDMFNAYAENLHRLDFAVKVFEIGLLILFLIHILFATLLFIENLGSRPQRYAVKKDTRRTWGSKTMPYTGATILVFLVVHLINFHFTDSNLTLSELVRSVLTQPYYAALYIICLLALALHISHGIWSLCQTLGINQPKYNKLLESGARSLSIAVGAVFILIPLLALFYSNFLL